MWRLESHRLPSSWASLDRWVTKENLCNAVGVDLPIAVLPSKDAEDAEQAAATPDNLGQASGANGSDEGSARQPPVDFDGSDDEGGNDFADHEQAAQVIRFSPVMMIECLKIADKLRDLVFLKSVVMSSLRATLPADESERICGNILSGELPLPGRKSLSHQRQKLDIMEMLWQREQDKDHVYLRYLSADSSPQIGMNFFAVREDRVCMCCTAPRRRLPDAARC